MLGGVGLVVVARAAFLIERPLWFDEIFTIWAARLSPRALLQVLREDSGPPLFYLLEKPLVLAAESAHVSDKLARLLPFAAVLGLFAMAGAIPDPPTRRRFTLLLAASPLLFLYSAEARAYGLLALAGFALCLLVLQAPETRRLVVAAALTAALALYTHYLAIFLVGALLLLAVVRRRRRAALGLLLGSLLFLPWLPVLLAQPREAVAWIREPAGRSLFYFLAALGGAPRVPPPFGAELPPWLLWPGAALGLALLLGVLAASRANRDVRAGAAVVLLVLGAAWLLSFRSPVAFPGRTELAVLPAWLWAVSLAGAGRRWLRLGTVASAALGAVTIGVVLAASWSAPAPHEPADVVTRLAKAGDLAVGGGLHFLPLRLRHDRGQLRANLLGFPRELERHPGWSYPLLPEPEQYRELQDALSRLPRGATAYLLLPRRYRTPDLAHALAAGVTSEIGSSSRTILLAWSAQGG